MDKLVCLLCRQPHTAPKMCPQCSQIFCHRCIQDYLIHSKFCPACDAYLPNPIDCTRLLDEVKQTLRIAQPQRKHRNCPKHDLPLKYECSDCNQVICSDCGMIDDQHRTHRIVPRQTLKNQFSRSRLREFLLQIDEHILQGYNLHQHHNLQKQILRSELKWCKNKLTEHYETLLQKLQTEALQILSQISQDILQKQQKISQLKLLKTDILNLLNPQTPEPNSLLLKLQTSTHQSIQNDINNYIQAIDKGDTFVRKSLTTLKEIYPEYINHTFQFNYEINLDQTVTYSPNVKVYGIQWRLKIYPRGNAAAEGKYLSLFLELVSVPEAVGTLRLDSNRYFYRLELISLNTAGRTISKEYCSNYVLGECWGYTDFLKLDQLQEYLNNGRLIFVMGVKAPTYYEVCRDWQRYNRKLQNQNRVLEELLSLSNLEPESSVFRLDQSNIVDED